MSGATGLVQAQSALLQALFGRRSDAALHAHLQSSGARAALNARGLQAYQANGAALAERVLQAAFPVLAELMGQDNFLPFAQYFWRQSPPERGDLAQWGAALPAFIDAAPQLAEEPFLGDVARIEWALHLAATSSDAELDAASLGLLASSEPELIGLRLDPGLALLASAYPVVSIVQAHGLLDAEKTAAIAQAAEQLRLNVAEQAVVWRQGFKPRLRACSAAEHALLAALLTGQSLDSALNAASQRDDAAPAFDFSAWLTQAVQTGVLTGVYVLPKP